MHKLTAISATSILALIAYPACAGRPLAVDDAAVNDRGAGHVEAWWSRPDGRDDVWTVAPAYAPWDGVEFAASVSRSRRDRQSTTSAQSKLLWRGADDDHCGVGTLVGAARITQGAGADERRTAPFVTMLTTCGTPLGDVHVNAGIARTSDGETTRSIGGAVEHAFGAWTWHVEWVAQRGAKPFAGIGVRTMITPRLQVDGTWSNQDGQSLVSFGIKVPF